MGYKKTVFTIDNVLKLKNLSKNWLQEKANLQWSQLNFYANNKVKRIDFEVLGRICTALNVQIEEIMKSETIKGRNYYEN
jgi:putative transcriptional regulator